MVQPEQFVDNTAQTAVTFSDQIPVWLKPAADRVPQTVRRKRRADGAAAAGGGYLQVLSLPVEQSLSWSDAESRASYEIRLVVIHVVAY